MNLYGLLDAIINKVNRAVKVEKQELDSSLQKQVRENISAPSKNEVCNPNLLDNWYFLNPVNQRGQTSYTNGYGIDRWCQRRTISTVSLSDSGVTITDLNNYEAGFIFDQDLPLKKQLVGKQVTVSLLVSEVSGNVAVQCGGGAMWITSVGLHSFTVDSYDNSDNLVYLLRLFNAEASSSITLIAAKVELGDTQTLAHQDFNGNWVLNEVPKYSEELLKCHQYDPYTGEYIGLRKFSQPRNLFDNSDFTNLVNQRGVSGTITSTGSCIDRWRLYKAGDKDESVSITLSDNGITFNNSSSYFQQRFPIGTLDSSKVYTVAIYYADGTVTAHPGECYFESDMDIVNTAWIIKVGRTVAHFALYEGKYTADTLPEYQPKGYTVELAECQRYYQKRSYEGPAICHRIIGEGALILPLSFKYPMRIEVPTISGSINVAAGQGFQGAQTPGLGISVQGFYAQIPIADGYTFEEGKSYYARGTVVLSAEL